MMKFTTTFLILLLGSLSMYQARADTLRCGTSLVDVGDSEYDLLEKCGEPSLRDDNRWIYDRGPEKLTIIVRVAQGKVQSIHTVSSEKP